MLGFGTWLLFVGICCFPQDLERSSPESQNKKVKTTKSCHEGLLLRGLRKQKQKQTMRKWGNKMPPKTHNSPKADPRGTNGGEVVKLYKIIKEETEKQTQR